MKIKMIVAAAVVSLTFFSAEVSAQTTVGPVTIKSISAAWNDEFAINTGTTLPNPANCPLSDMADASATTVSGYKTFLATALTAVSNGQNITASLSNTACSNSRPMIIGLTITP